VRYVQHMLTAALRDRVGVPRELGDRQAARVKSRSVIGAMEATPGRRWDSLTASCTHTASDVFVILIDHGAEDSSGVLKAP